ncbi:hypothetical protein [Aliarcobacter butzleri]|uniref:Uncharacterized protein n=1 Tax=Aliarcobacter butzleri TaxID=28197 RepID=A0AAP4PWZ9_9BACT|nr:hypothetical protein [Aliarcobacter butzleri]MDN5051594.1 hypothetical protein [Aliarcobacter butzleri]MDN5074905.1 hypothetical protein [Aliarcobacter butzleri]MDN5115751.1 hypothetical protein [Aliarcobacter butzleri]MDN5131528.1 hypothetical protein [Aliarcobacter butzleri]NUW25763.1 hypothetical protein [Aliarcobacter butzleri]
MRAKKIAEELLARQIKISKNILLDINILSEVLFWARESAREYFSSEVNKLFLVSYIDDVAPIVDEYIINKSNKMYEKAIKSQNKLFQNLYSNEKTISWIIDRWINTFLNLTTNSNYRDYIDIKNLKVEFIDENYGFNDDKLELGIEFEKVKKLSKKEKIKLLKEVWKEARYDDFDERDMLYLAEKLGLKLNEVFDNCGDLIKLNLKKEQDESGNSQLVIVF